MKAKFFLYIMTALVAITMSATAFAAGVSGTLSGRGNGREVSFVRNSNDVTDWAGVLKLNLDHGPTIDVFCIQLDVRTSIGNRYVSDGTVLSLHNGAYILSVLQKYPASSAGSADEAAARQLAVWHFSDDQDLSTIKDANIRDRAMQIAADAQANPASANTSSPDLTISSPNTTAQVGQVITLNISAGGDFADKQVTLTTDGGYFTNADGSQNAGASINISLDGNGNATAWIVRTDAGEAHINAALDYNLDAGTVFVHEHSPNKAQRLVMASPQQLTATFSITGNWTQQYGSFKLRKVVKNETGAELDPSIRFHITATGPSFPQGKTYEFGPQGGEITEPQVLVGEYTFVEEKLQGNWAVEGNNVTITVVAGQEANHTVTNTLKNQHRAGSLTVNKIVNNESGKDLDPALKIVLDITGPDFADTAVFGPQGGSKTFDNLKAGVYHVTERKLGGLWKASGEGDVTVETDKSASITITNTLGKTTTCPANKYIVDGAFRSTCDMDAPAVQFDNWAFYVPNPSDKRHQGHHWDDQGKPLVFWDKGWIKEILPIPAGWSPKAVREALEAYAQKQGLPYDYFMKAEYHPNDNPADPFAGTHTTKLTWRQFIEVFGGAEFTSSLIVARTPDGEKVCEYPIIINRGAHWFPCPKQPEFGAVEATKLVDWAGIDPIPGIKFTFVLEGNNYRETREVEPNQKVRWDNVPVGNYTLREEVSGQEWSVAITNDGNVVVEAGKTAEVTVTNTHNGEETLPNCAVGDGGPSNVEPAGDYIQFGEGESAVYYTIAQVLHLNPSCFAGAGFMSWKGNFVGHAKQWTQGQLVITAPTDHIFIRIGGNKVGYHKVSEKTVKGGSKISAQAEGIITINFCHMTDTGRFDGLVTIVTYARD